MAMDQSSIQSIEIGGRMSVESYEWKEKCPICLGKRNNKAYTDNCIHEFCYDCLKQWSNVKAECPMCKKKFTKIYYNIKDDEHDVYVVKERQPNIESFGYLNATRTLRQNGVDLTNLSRSQQYLLAENFRRIIYLHNSWVIESTSSLEQPNLNIPVNVSGRVRDTSPEFYRANPACMHRLYPWLFRELNALNTLPIHSQSTPSALFGLVASVPPLPINVNHVVDYILYNIRLYDITGELFQSLLANYISSSYVAHFVHEFHAFALSPVDSYTDFDMVAFYNIPSAISSYSVVITGPNHGSEAAQQLINNHDTSSGAVTCFTYYRYNQVPPRLYRLIGNGTNLLVNNATHPTYNANHNIYSDYVDRFRTGTFNVPFDFVGGGGGIGGYRPGELDMNLVNNSLISTYIRTMPGINRDGGGNDYTFYNNNNRLPNITETHTLPPANSSSTTNQTAAPLPAVNGIDEDVIIETPSSHHLFGNDAPMSGPASHLLRPAVQFNHVINANNSGYNSKHTLPTPIMPYVNTRFKIARRNKYPTPNINNLPNFSRLPINIQLAIGLTKKNDAAETGRAVQSNKKHCNNFVHNHNYNGHCQSGGPISLNCSTNGISSSLMINGYINSLDINNNNVLPGKKVARKNELSTTLSEGKSSFCEVIQTLPPIKDRKHDVVSVGSATTSTYDSIDKLPLAQVKVQITAQEMLSEQLNNLPSTSKSKNIKRQPKRALKSKRKNNDPQVRTTQAATLMNNPSNILNSNELINQSIATTLAVTTPKKNRNKNNMAATLPANNYQPPLPPVVSHIPVNRAQRSRSPSIEEVYSSPVFEMCAGLSKIPCIDIDARTWNWVKDYTAWWVARNARKGWEDDDESSSPSSPDEAQDSSHWSTNLPGTKGETSNKNGDESSSTFGSF